MNESIAVIYEGGVLRPLQPLALPERTRLEVQLVRRRRRAGRPASSWLTTPCKPRASSASASCRPRDLPTISEAQLAAAACDLSVAGPLSELIIAEREGR